MRRKVPFVAQTQKTECGLCCVCMINRYYKNYITMEELREKMEVGRDGSSFQQLVQLLNDYNLSTKNYRIPVKELYRIHLPAIVFWGNNHFIILEKVNQKKKRLTIVDPAIGRLKLQTDEFEEKYTEYVVVPLPTANFKKNLHKTHSIKYILPYIFSNKVLYIKIISVSVLVYLFTLSLPIVIQKVIDGILNHNAFTNSDQLILLIIGLSILYFITSFWKNSLLIKLRTHLDKSLNTNIFEHLLNLPYKFFSVRSSGDIIYSLNSCLNIREIFANQFITAVINVGTAIAILAYVFTLSHLLGITAFLLFVLNIVLVSLTRPILADNSRSIKISQSIVQGVQMETIYSMLGVKMSAIEKDILLTWKQAYGKYLRKYIENEKVANYVYSLNSFLQFLSPTLLLMLGILLIEKGNISMGSIIAIYSLGNTFFSLSGSVIDLWTSFINSSVIFERLADIIKSEEEDNRVHNNVLLNGTIELKNVSFRYTKDSAYVLKDINFKVKSGMKIAIVGKSGSGKSTLAKLLVGLFIPSEGDIFFNDTNFLALDRKKIRRQIGIVPQDITLFNDSIYDNIVMNRAGINLDDVKYACRIAHISEEIESMPMQYYTQISEMGLNLSGGQRQRIALARAIIGKPKILLLDEATSSLDNINEKMVSDEIKKMGTTQIIIAHRLSTIIDASVIVVLEAGKVVEIGKHDELIAKNGHYRKLYSSLL
ncbi:peptidase domain-containing ABC transporter [Anaerosacchariphilus polymeriproducens]|uniref:peptidase domain-containing ABC transporter n=1 Tax=Anaerosacchariphilus polymeriproducens TaxID=1812858 RepID=UPI00138FB926|nr:peptidase domain-containing ABC transporter [Anaerosacchariphilus polymeriproducens]